MSNSSLSDFYFGKHACGLWEMHLAECELFYFSVQSSEEPSCGGGRSDSRSGFDLLILMQRGARCGIAKHLHNFDQLVENRRAETFHNCSAAGKAERTHNDC